MSRENALQARIMAEVEAMVPALVQAEIERLGLGPVATPLEKPQPAPEPELEEPGGVPVDF